MNKLEVLYEDNHLVVVVKQANVPSQQDSSNDLDLLTMVKNYIKEKYHKPGNVYIGLIHRLDRPVSGIMVFARTSKAASRLSDQIRKNEFSKKYLGVVNGIIEKNEDTLVDYLKKEENGNTVVTDSSDGKESILAYKVLERNYEKKETLVEIQLKTGRHHQIRVQFASRNHPLCGDQRYGRMDKTQIALCAYHLEFIHPTTKEKMIFDIEKPNTQYWVDFKM
ncbi:MAG: RluA family pseudouridine synthase, partial [Bacilli bacterium]|nr:RluA family pseudouridine synthase [Bacilli bacterium]